MRTKTKKWTLLTALATAFVSVLSLAFAIMPKTQTVLAQNSADADYVQAISALDRATKYTITSDSVGGNMTIGGGTVDTPAPIGTKMYFSYTVESAAAGYRGSWYEEGLSVFNLTENGVGAYSHDKGLVRCETQCSPHLLKNGHTYYCIIEKTSDTSFEYNIYKNENGNIRLAFKNSDNELSYTYDKYPGVYPLSNNGGMGLYFYANISNLKLTNVSACYVDENNNLIEGTMGAAADEGAFTVAKDEKPLELPNGVEELVASADKYVAQGQANGTIAIVGGDADNIAPLNTKMYFSYKVQQIEKCVAQQSSSGNYYLEEGLIVSGVTGNWSHTHGKTLYNGTGTGALFQEGCTYYAEIIKTSNDNAETTGVNENNFTAKIYMKDKEGKVSLVWDTDRYNGNYDEDDSKDFTMEQSPYFGLYAYADIDGLVLSDVCAVYEKADGSLVQGAISVGGQGANLTLSEQSEKVTVTVVAKDGSEMDSQEFSFGASYTLPESEAEYFLGWNVGEALYNENDEIKLYEDVTITETTFEFKTMVGAGIRAADRSGIRFGTLVNKADWDKLSALGINITTGTLITPTDYLADENVFVGESSLKQGKTLKNIENDGFAKTVKEGGVDYYVYYGSLVNLQNKNYARAFSGTSYATLTVAGVETTIYGGYSKENQSRSVYQVAKAVLADTTSNVSNAQKDKAQEFVDSVVMATIEGTTVTMDANGSTAYEVTVDGTTVTITAKEGKNLSNVKSIVLNGVRYTEFTVENNAIVVTLSTGA